MVVMTRILLRLFLGGVLLSISWSCQNAPSVKRESTAIDRSWSGRMQGLSSEVKGLVPYIYHRAHFSDPGHEQIIRKRIEHFKAAVHQVPGEQGKAIMGGDPLLTYSLTQLSSDLDRAEEAFAMGRKEYARGVLKSAMNHCFRCHSSTGRDSKAKWSILRFKGLQLAPVEVADLKVATRDFVGARGSLRSAVLDFESAQARGFDYETAVKKYLALSIRQVDSLEKKEEVIDTFESIAQSPSVPRYIRNFVGVWQQSLFEWKKSSGKSLSFQDAVHLLSKGRRRQSYFKDHSGDVEFLWASRLLHESLMHPRSNSKTALIYLHLGETYEVLDELGYWGLHEVYYESCVRAQPKSKTGRVCLARLRNSLNLGYTGSSGTDLPRVEKHRLRELEQLVR